jgi:hypothetical protein
MNKEIIKQLRLIKSRDQDKSLFYSWDNLPHRIQDEFIVWCKKYMQVDHADCFGGWGFGWSKYHNDYIEFLTNTKLFLKNRDML